MLSLVPSWFPSLSLRNTADTLGRNCPVQFISSSGAALICSWHLCSVMDLNQQSLRMLPPRKVQRRIIFLLQICKFLIPDKPPIPSWFQLVSITYFNIDTTQSDRSLQFRSSACVWTQECFPNLCLPLGDSNQAALHSVWKETMTSPTERTEKLHLSATTHPAQNDLWLIPGSRKGGTL